MTWYRLPKTEYLIRTYNPGLLLVRKMAPFIYFVCVDALRLSLRFSVMTQVFSVFLGRASTKQRIKCLVQEHNTVPFS